MANDDLSGIDLSGFNVVGASAPAPAPAAPAAAPAAKAPAVAPVDKTVDKDLEGVDLSGFKVASPLGGNSIGGTSNYVKIGSENWLFSHLLHQESRNRQVDEGGRPITSSAGAIGVAQVMPGTAPLAAKLAGLPFDERRYKTDKEYNKALGAAYFAKQLEDFGSEDKALAAYNAGPGALERGIARATKAGNPADWLRYMPAETRAYVPSIIGAAKRTGATPSTLANAPSGAVNGVPPEAEYDYRANFQAAKPAGPGRTAGEAVKDTALGVASGIASIGKAAGDLYGMATGDTDNIASSLGKRAQENIEAMQSPALREKRADRSAAIEGADGALSKAWTAIATTLTDPALAADMVASNIASMVPSAMAGRMVQGAVGARAMLSAMEAGPLSIVAREAIAKSAAGWGVTAAKGAGALQQGASVASQAYDQAIAKPQEVWDANPEYTRRVMAGDSPEMAKHALALQSAREALPAAIAVSFGAQSLPAGDTIERSLVGGLARVTGGKAGAAGMAGRVAKGAVGEGASEALEEGGGQGAANLAVQRNVDPKQDLLEQVGENAGMGAAGGILLGGPAGVLHTSQAPAPKTPVEQAVDQKLTTLAPVAEAAAAGGTLSKAAMAGNSPAALAAQAEQVLAGAQQEQAQAAEAAKPKTDPIGERVTAIAAAAREPGFLDKLRGETSPADVKKFVSDLALAQSPSAAPAAREQALSRLEFAMDWAGQQVATPISSGVDEVAAVAAVGDASTRSAPTTPQQRQAGADRDKDLQDQINAAPTAADRSSAQAQAQTNREVRMGAPAAAPAPAPVAAPAADPQAQERVEAAAATSTPPRDQRALDGTNLAVSGAMKAIEARGGVASQAEADLLQRAGAGTPFDRIDPALTDARTTAPAVPASAPAPEQTGIYVPPQRAARNPDRLERTSSSVEQVPVAPFTTMSSEPGAAPASDLETIDGADLYDTGGLSLAERSAERAAAADTDAPLTNVPTPAVRIPEGAGTAQTRKRKEVLRQLVDNGLNKVERRPDGFFLVNSKGRQQFKLDGMADAQLARNQILQAIAAGAAQANTNPTEGQKEAGNYKKGRVEFDGLSLAIENPVGSVRRGTSPDGTKWETPLNLAHYGDVTGTVSSDGDAVDVYLMKEPRHGAPVFTFDQYNDDGTFDETKSVVGATSQAEAERVYDAGFSDGSGPQRRRAVTQRTVDEFKAWANSPAAKKPSAGEIRTADSVPADDAPIVFRYEGKRAELQRVTELPEKESVDRGGRALRVTKRDGQILDSIAKAFGKRVVFFNDGGASVGDGFIINDDPSTIYINQSTGISPLTVFGHELTHQLKFDNPAAHAALEAAVQARMKGNAAAELSQYYEEGSVLNELTSDLGGDFMSDPAFWQDVFGRVREANPEQAQSIIAQLAEFFYRAVNALTRNLRTYGADKLIDDVEGAREAFKSAIAQYIQDQGISKQAMQASVMKAGAEAKRSAERQVDAFASDIATKRTVVSLERVVSSKGDTETYKVGNVNSEGAQITGTKQGLKNFWEWFGDSEIVGDKGRPLVVYHSTNADIAEFKTMVPTKNTGMFGSSYDAKRAGIFFTADRTIAQQYAGGDGNNIVPAYLSMQNPADMRNVTPRLESELEAAGYNPRMLSAPSVQYTWELFDEEYGGPELVAALKKAGYDGAIIDDRTPDEEQNDFVSYVAFDSNSIKSAMGNLGTFSPASGDITRSADRKTVKDLTALAARGERVVGSRAAMSPDEKQAIKFSAETTNVSEREIASQVREHKLANPPAQGWAPLVFNKAKIEKGKLQYEYKAVPYTFADGKGGKVLKPGTPEYDRRVKAIGKGMTDEVRRVHERALAGDANAKNILAQAGWYKAMRSRLRHEFGGLGDLFADLLGATSPNTPVRDNWSNAVDSLRRASKGDFDNLIPAWESWVEGVESRETALRAWFNDQLAQGRSKKAVKDTPTYKTMLKELAEARKLPDSLLPLKDNDKKYGFNGKNVARAMVDMWRVVRNAEPDIGRGTTAPKAINFSGNLIGFRERATIDVWAARMLQRLSGGVRVPSMAETGVSGAMQESGATTLQFGFGQDVFSDAVKRIRADADLKTDKTLANINDDDLQAVVWFVEKELWTVNNWTNAAGEGGSFELEANLAGPKDQAKIRALRKTADSSKTGAAAKARALADLAAMERTVDRFTGGLSIQQSASNQGVDVIPTDAAMAQLASDIRTAIYESDDGVTVLASKALSTEGRYGDVERSLDLEVVAREGYDPAPLWRTMLEKAKETGQDSTFMSRVLREGEDVDYLKHRPGMEIYFREAAAGDQLTATLANLERQGVGFLTVVVDGRRSSTATTGAMPAAVGVRLQYIPEFDQRYGMQDLLSMSDDELSTTIKEKRKELQVIADKVAMEVDGASFSGVFWYETEVAFRNQYEEKLNALSVGNSEGVAGRAGAAAGGPRWAGQRIHDGLAGADRYAREAAGGQPGGAERGNAPGTGDAAGQPAGRAKPRRVRDAGSIRRSAERVAEPRGSDQGSGGSDREDLIGLPTKSIDIPGYGPVVPGHFAPARAVAERYTAKRGIAYEPPTTFAKVDPERAKRIADAFEEMTHDPRDPEVAAAYKALADETIAQYEAVLASGLEVEFIGDTDPYAASPRLATEDVRNNNHMWIYGTRDGFGSSADFDPVENPLLAETQFEISGQKALVNDLFRVVHDYFGHVKEGVGFRADGEENAWRSHAAMFTPLARRALTTETRGQNSWVNFGPYGAANRIANGANTVFADQKVNLLPEWVTDDGRGDEITRSAERSPDQQAQAALDALGLDILSEEQISEYNDSRFDNGAFNPEVSALNWTHEAGMSRKDFYVIDPSGESRGLRRTAWFYPDGVDGGDGSPQIILEDEGGEEIDAPSIIRSAERVTDTAAFKKWFARSRVTESGRAGGKPMVVYHGTRSDFSAFDPAFAELAGTWGNGFYFTSDADNAADYAMDETGGALMPVYLSIQNPAPERFWKPLIKSIDRGEMSEYDLRDIFEREGYDGVATGEIDRIGERGYVAFRPEQIKSSVGNNGDFSAEDPDITRSAERLFNPDLKRGVILPQTPEEETLGHRMNEVSAKANKAWADAFRASKEPVRVKLREHGFTDIDDATFERIVEDLTRSQLDLESEAFDGYRKLNAEVNEISQRRREMLIDRVGPPEFDGMRQPDEFMRPQIESPEFKEWFDGSLVRKPDGTPLIAFHGTASDISSFKTQQDLDYKATSNNWLGQLGSWFAAPMDGGEYDVGNAEYTSDSFAEMKSRGSLDGQVLYPVYLSIKNPKIYEDYEDLVDDRTEAGSPRAYLDRARAEGYDGVVIYGSNTDGGQYRNDWVAFEPTQIKSAIGNSGAFSSTDPDITRSKERITGNSGRAYSTEQLEMFRNTGRTTEPESIIARLKEARKDAAKKIAQGVVDQFRPIRDLGGEAYTLARLSKGAAGAFEALLHHGKLKLVENAYDADQTGGFIERVGNPLGAELEDFMQWIAANRAEQLSKEDREHLFTPADIAAGKSLADGQLTRPYQLTNGVMTTSRQEAYNDSLAKFNEFNKNTMDMAEQSGLIDPEARKIWETQFYVPFYRVSEEDGAFMGTKIKGGIGRQQAFKKLKGGKDKLNSDLLSNTLQNWAHLIDAAAKNRAARATLETAQKVGVAIEAPQEVVKDMAKSTANKNGVVWFMDGGKQRHFLVEDPHLMVAINSLEYAGMKGPLMDALSTMKHWLTVGVTASPAFKVRNLIRDTISAIGITGLSYNPVKNLSEGWVASRRDSQEYVSALASGGLVRFGTMMDGNASERIRSLVKRGVKESTILNNKDKVKAFYDKFVDPGVQAYHEIGNRGEEVNRSALYSQLRKQGVGHAEAALMARDMMDFSMQGTWASIRFLTQVVPFMNARLQGLYKLGRAAQEDPKRFAMVTGAVALFSIALQAAYGDDDDWKKREDFDRDGFWWFKFGGTAFRIPKPFEIGAIASVAERGVELFTNDEFTAKRFAGRMLHLVSDNLSMNPVPQAVKPIIDVYANKDAFSGRPIETASMEKLKSEYRFNANTSVVARGISTALNAGTGIIGAEALSPVQVDSMMRGYFGWLGTFVVGGADMAIRPMMNEPSRPQADYMKVVTQGFLRQLPEPGSKYVSEVYEQATKLEQAYATHRQLLKDGKNDEAARYAIENSEDLGKYKRVEAVKQKQAADNKRIREIERSTTKTPSEKRDEIQRIRDASSRSAQAIY